MPLQVVPDGSELHFPGGTTAGLVGKRAGPVQPAAASATTAASAAHTRGQRRESRSPAAIRADRMPAMVTTSSYGRSPLHDTMVHGGLDILDDDENAAGNAAPGRVGEGLRSAARLGGRAWIGGRQRRRGRPVHARGHARAHGSSFVATEPAVSSA